MTVENVGSQEAALDLLEGLRERGARFALRPGGLTVDLAGCDMRGIHAEAGALEQVITLLSDAMAAVIRSERTVH
jgi:hypothetical protein